MTTDLGYGTQASLLEPDLDESPAESVPTFGSPVSSFGAADVEDDEPLRPINWNLLTGDEAEAEWLDLNAWVNRLRTAYGLPPTVVPPYWHRHDELVWELSALHTHWLNAYDTDGSPSAPVAWHRDFADARNRLREWVSTSGTRLDRDRPTRYTAPHGPARSQPNLSPRRSSRTAMPTSWRSWFRTSPCADASRHEPGPSPRPLDHLTFRLIRSAPTGLGDNQPGVATRRYIFACIDVDHDNQIDTVTVDIVVGPPPVGHTEVVEPANRLHLRRPLVTYSLPALPGG